MTVTCTFRDILDTGHWEDYCKGYGINEWCVAEGLAESGTEVTISIEDAKRYGLFKEI